MRMRKGAAKGTGRGYQNLRNFPKDPIVHSDSGRGRKQPQRISSMIIAHKAKGDEEIITKKYYPGCGRWIRNKDDIAVYRCGDRDSKGNYHLHKNCKHY